MKMYNSLVSDQINQKALWFNFLIKCAAKKDVEELARDIDLNNIKANLISKDQTQLLKSLITLWDTCPNNQLGEEISSKLQFIIGMFSTIQQNKNINLFPEIKVIKDKVSGQDKKIASLTHNLMSFTADDFYTDEVKSYQEKYSSILNKISKTIEEIKKGKVEGVSLQNLEAALKKNQYEFTDERRALAEACSAVSDLLEEKEKALQAKAIKNGIQDSKFGYDFPFPQWVYSLGVNQVAIILNATDAELLKNVTALNTALDRLDGDEDFQSIKEKLGANYEELKKSVSNAVQQFRTRRDEALKINLEGLSDTDKQRLIGLPSLAKRTGNRLEEIARLQESWKNEQLNRTIYYANKWENQYTNASVDDLDEIRNKHNLNMLNYNDYKSREKKLKKQKEELESKLKDNLFPEEVRDLQLAISSINLKLEKLIARPDQVVALRSTEAGGTSFLKMIMTLEVNPFDDGKVKKIKVPDWPNVELEGYVEHWLESIGNQRKAIKEAVYAKLMNDLKTEAGNILMNLGNVKSSKIPEYKDIRQQLQNIPEKDIPLVEEDLLKKQEATTVLIQKTLEPIVKHYWSENIPDKEATKRAIFSFLGPKISGEPSFNKMVEEIISNTRLPVELAESLLNTYKSNILNYYRELKVIQELIKDKEKPQTKSTLTGVVEKYFGKYYGKTKEEKEQIKKQLMESGVSPSSTEVGKILYGLLATLANAEAALRGPNRNAEVAKITREFASNIRKDSIKLGIRTEFFTAFIIHVRTSKMFRNYGEKLLIAKSNNLHRKSVDELTPDEYKFFNALIQEGNKLLSFYGSENAQLVENSLYKIIPEIPKMYYIGYQIRTLQRLVPYLEEIAAARITISSSGDNFKEKYSLEYLQSKLNAAETEDKKAGILYDIRSLIRNQPSNIASYYEPIFKPLFNQEIKNFNLKKLNEVLPENISPQKFELIKTNPASLGEDDYNTLYNAWMESTFIPSSEELELNNNLIKYHNALTTNKWQIFYWYFSSKNENKNIIDSFYDRYTIVVANNNRQPNTIKSFNNEWKFIENKFKKVEEWSKEIQSWIEADPKLLSSREGEIWLRSDFSQSWLISEPGKNWLLSDKGIQWLVENQQLFESINRSWLNSDDGKKFIKELESKI